VLSTTTHWRVVPEKCRKICIAPPARDVVHDVVHAALSRCTSRSAA
jgi:hypothetical protein